MKKLFYILLAVLMTGCIQAQQFQVYANPSGTLKPLPNGNPIIVPGASNAATTTITDNNALNFTVYPTWVQASSGAQPQQTSSTKWTFNPASGLLTASGFVGPLTGNAATASLLFTPRAINGVNFDGSAPITVTAAAGTLTGSALNNTITSAPGLTSVSVGTLGTMAIQGANAVTVTGGTIDNATITGLPTPVNPNDAASKIYVDNAVSAGLVVRTGVQVATTANIALTGEQTIDGVLTSASRILVKNQTLSQNNGIYITGIGAWSRATDSDTAAELKVGYYYFVSSGTTQASTGWTILTAPTVLGTDPIAFVQFSSSTTYTAGTGLNLAGNAFSIAPAQSGLAITSSAFNGTVGSTTPSTGSFTTLGASGNSLLANLVIKSSQLNEFATNALGSVDINFDGYNGGTTQFRNLNVYDGKNNLAATFTGSTKALNVVGPITAASYNGNTITTGTATLTGAASKTLAWNNSITLAGTDGVVLTTPTTSFTAARTDAGNTFTGHQTIEGVTSTGATGTGNLVFATAPTLGAITASSITITNTNGTTGATNSPAVGQQINFNPFTNATTTTVALPSAVNGNNFMLYFQACNAASTVTFTGASVFREGNPDVALAGGLYTPGPAGNHSALLKMVNSRWMLSDDSYQATYIADSGTANTYVMTLAPAISAYATGSPIYSFIAGNANTGASTLNINGLGAKTIKKFTSVSPGADLAANDIRAGQLVVVAYDGTNFQVISLLGNAGGGGGGSGITLSKTVTAAGHGLSVGTLYGMWNSTGTTWVKASASSSGLGKITGVAQPIDANTFTLIEAGDITTSGLTAGSQYYLTDDASGLLSLTQPSALTSFVVPVLITGSTTLAVVQIGTPASLAKININTDVTAFTSANLAAALTDETGTGVAVFNSSPTINGAILGGGSLTSALIDTPTISGNPSFLTNGVVRTFKTAAHETINVKDYGAIGDGVTDDSSAIANAIGSLPASNAILHFPAGTYLCSPTSAALVTIASKTKWTICGDGIGTSTILSSVAGQTMAFASSCSYITVRDITINGGCTARTTGAHCFYSQAPFTTLTNVEIKQSGEFALFLDTTTDAQVDHISINNCFADGVHFNAVTRGTIADCSVTGSDDDCYAISGCTDITLNGGLAKGRAYGECMAAGSGAGGSGNDYIPTYTYNNTTTTPPASATFRMNSATPASVTLIWVNDTDLGGFNMSTVFFGNSFLDTGSILFVANQASRLTNYQKYTVSGTPTHTGAYTIIPVTFLSSAGTIANAATCSVSPASVWGRGLYLAGDTDTVVTGLNIDTVKQSGVRGEILSSTRNTRVHLNSVKVRNSTTNGGGNGIWFVNSTDCSIMNCSVEDIAAGSLIEAADWQNLTISNCFLTQGRAQFCRGFDTDTGITTPTAWNGLKFINNSISLKSASNNESIRMAPASAITITNSAITGNTSSQASSGDYIFTDYTAVPIKVGNNTSQEGRSISNGGHGTAPTAFNNN